MTIKNSVLSSIKKENKMGKPLSIKEIMAARKGGTITKPLVKSQIAEEPVIQADDSAGEDEIAEGSVDNFVIPEETAPVVQKPLKPIVAKKTSSVAAAKPVVVKKPVVQVADEPKVVQTELPDDEAAEPAPVVSRRGRKKAAWGPVVRPNKEKKDLKVGDWMPFEEFANRFHSHLVEQDLAPPSKSITTSLIKEFERFFYTVIADYDVKFIQKTTRTEISPRIYEPNKALDRVATPYHTFVSGHTKVSLSWTFNRTATKGTIDDNSNFIEGMFDEDGNFIPGIWSKGEDDEDIFTPN